MLSGSMIKSKPILSLASGIVLVLATMIGIALANEPQAADAAVMHDALVPCPLAAISLDQGYGVSSKELRPVCSTDR